MSLDVHFTSGKDDWRTPRDIFDPIRDRYRLTVDAAADAQNALLPRWYGEGGERPSGLTLPWDVHERYWFNPPYSRGLQSLFIGRAVEHAQAGGLSVGLLPARTDTIMFHDYIWDREANRPRPWIHSLDFVKGRIRFVGAEHGAPFPSMIVTFAVPL